MRLGPRVGLLIAAAAMLLAYGLAEPYANFLGTVYVDLDKGMPARKLAERLADAGVIRYAWLFLAVRALHPSARVQAGEYEFHGPESVWRVFDRVRRGDVYYFELTVPEGSNIFDIAALLNQAGLVPAAEFLASAADPRMVRDLDPAAPSLEGYLFPSTYRINHVTTAEELCRQMTAEFRRHWKQLVSGAKDADPHTMVTLASMVEKETAAPDERPLIASVFFNRLQKQMRLECDPTTIYAAELEQRYRGAIHRSDLASQNLYNTYQHTGLPPGPIANPGVESLKAVLHPAETDYLFFVAKPGGSGEHHFSATLAQHEKAVKDYRSGQAKVQAR